MNGKLLYISQTHGLLNKIISMIKHRKSFSNDSFDSSDQSNNSTEYECNSLTVLICIKQF